MTRVRDGAGLLLVAVSLACLFYGVTELRQHDYLASGLMLLSGLAFLRAAVEILRPTVGE